VNLTAVFNYLMGECRKNGARLLFHEANNQGAVVASCNKGNSSYV